MATRNQAATGRRTSRFGVLIQRFVTSLHILLYRLSGGRIGGHMFNNPVLLLITIGRKTGKQRVTPLLYVPDGENMLLIASNGGAPTHPAWYQNLKAHPVTEVEIGRRKLQVRAEDAPREELDRLWPKVISAYSGYAEYRKRTDREIPIVILRPVEQ